VVRAQNYTAIPLKGLERCFFQMPPASLAARRHMTDPTTTVRTKLTAQYIAKGSVTTTCPSGGSGHLNIGVVSRIYLISLFANLREGS
jgi:hypothetical protein